MGKKNKQKPAAPAMTDDELLDAAIAANREAASRQELDLIAPGQFAEEKFPELQSSADGTLPTPPVIARADLPEVARILREFGRASAPLADLCLLRLTMTLSKEGKKLRLHIPDSSNVASTSAALRALMAEDPQFLKAVFSSMEAHRADSMVQNSALALLTSISGVGGDQSDSGQEGASDVLANAGVFAHLQRSMLAHPHDARIQVGACCVLSATCRGGSGRAAKRRQLALDAGMLTATLRSLSLSERVVPPGLRSALGEGGNAAKVRMSDAMLRTEAEAFMRREACAALIHLCESEAWCAAAADAGGLGVVGGLLGSHQDAELQRHGCGLLERMCLGDDERAERRRAMACEQGALAALCSLREAVGPVKRAARNALQGICGADAARWHAAQLAGAPQGWLPSAAGS